MFGHEAILGLLIPFIGTSTGAVCVFFMKKNLSKAVQLALTGFAAGVMVAASIWSLLIPAMEQSEMVFQDVVLFDDTVMENIRLGRHGASDKEVRAAAAAANCDEFVNKLPQGYDTPIGENGAKLSGGERQRISIARALLKDAPIVLLENLLMIVLNITLRKYGGDALGDDYITCATVVQSFMVLVYSPGYGFTQGCGTLYGYNYGAGNYKRVMDTFRWVLIVCAIYMGIISILSQTIPTMFVRIFLKDERLIRLASTCIRRYAAGLLGVAVQYAFVDGLTAMGQIKYAMPLSLFRKILYIGAVLLIPLFLPLDIVFWAETLCDFGGAAVTLVVFIMIIKPNLKKVCQ